MFLSRSALHSETRDLTTNEMRPDRCHLTVMTKNSVVRTTHAYFEHGSFTVRGESVFVRNVQSGHNRAQSTGAYALRLSPPSLHFSSASSSVPQFPPSSALQWFCSSSRRFSSSPSPSKQQIVPTRTVQHTASGWGA
jgi:hypothetical protein